MTNLTLIVAHDKNLCIGNNNQLLFRLKEDLRRFKQHTMGKPIIMGRKTYESIGRPLPGRCNIVVSSTLTDNLPSIKVCGALEEAIAYAREHIQDNASAKEIMIIGGGDIYRQALPQATRLLITEVGREAEGDTYFPDYATGGWDEEEAESYNDDGIPCVFRTLVKKAT